MEIILPQEKYFKTLKHMIIGIAGMQLFWVIYNLLK